MDLKQTALVGAAHLIGITFTLRRLYQPSFVTPEPIASVLTHLERHAAGSHAGRPCAQRDALPVGEVWE